MLNLLAILLVIACMAPAHPVTAQEDDVYELIRLINELRASSGLEPYTVDPGLMALASPTLPAETGTQQNEGVLVSPVIDTLRDTITPSSPNQTISDSTFAKPYFPRSKTGIQWVFRRK